MRFTDISREARNTLNEIYVLKKYSEDEELDFEDVFQNFVTNIYLYTEEESKKFRQALEELKINDLIEFDIEENTELEEIPTVENLALTEKATIYILKYIVYSGGLDYETRGDISDTFKKISENGVYIVLVAIIPILCMVIDTVFNIINTFR